MMNREVSASLPSRHRQQPFEVDLVHKALHPDRTPKRAGLTGGTRQWEWQSRCRRRRSLSAQRGLSMHCQANAVKRWRTPSTAIRRPDVCALWRAVH